MERTLDQRIERLKGELLKMAAAVEESIAQSVQSLADRDNGLAEAVIAGGREIDEWEVRIEDECLKLLAMRHPVASDLRLVAAMIKINYDLERINDQAVNIAERALVLNEMPLLKPLIDIPRMSELARSMVKDALDNLLYIKLLHLPSHFFTNFQNQVSFFHCPLLPSLKTLRSLRQLIPQ